jgi:hypothetical protein
MKPWQKILLVLAILGAFCYASVLLGISIGRSLAESDFNAPQRDLGRAFTELRDDIQKQNYTVAERKIDFLATNWHSIEFFKEEASPPRIPWYRFIHDYESFDKQN